MPLPAFQERRTVSCNLYKERLRAAYLTNYIDQHELSAVDDERRTILE